MSGEGRGHLLRNIVLFGRLLRSLGMPVTPPQILALVDGLRYIALSQREDVKNAARTMLVSQHEHLALFDRAFDLFWQAKEKRLPPELQLGSAADSQTDAKKNTSAASNHSGESTNSNRSPVEPAADALFSYSAGERLRRKDFADLTPDEMEEIKRMMRQMAWRLEQRRTRRKMPALRGAHLDLRRTFRQNWRYGGEPLRLAWHERKRKRRPLVVLADISGSMERYSRVLLKFIYLISSGLKQVEAFVFSTRLTRITHHLREKNIDLALAQVSASVDDWAGGTRIGDALKHFNYEWGRRVLGRGAIVLIISDGWDRGDIDLLSREMKRLQLSSQRLIWLNPLLGSENYQPLTRGIRAALPYVDDFLPVHNLVSLEQLGDLLERLSEHKPARPHYVTD